MHFVLPNVHWPVLHEDHRSIAGIAIILAVSLNIVNGMTGQFSLGHAAFMALGGYAAGVVTYYGSMLHGDTPRKHGGFLGSGEWLFVAACVVGGIVATIAGYIVGLPSLRLKGDYLAIVTLGFGEILRVVSAANGADDRPAAAELKKRPLSQLFFPPPLGGAVGFNGLPKYTNLFWVYDFVVFMLVVAFRLKRSSLGRAMISVREDEFAAQSMGVNVSRIKVLAFMMAAFFAGTAGGLVCARKWASIISPRDAGFQRSLDYVLMTVLGGRGSITGVMLAAILLTVLPEALRDFDQYRLIVYALVLIGMMLLRPQGLFGIHEIWDFWRPKRSRVARREQRPEWFASTWRCKVPWLPPRTRCSMSTTSAFRLAASRRCSIFRFALPRGGLYGLIGPNGAGKTTVFNLLTGVYQTMGGRMTLDSQNLVGLKPHEVAAAGLLGRFRTSVCFPA